jgi:hypothetical protein
MPNSKKQGPRGSNHPRNTRMRELRQQSPKLWTYRRLAKEFDLSPERVRVICTYPHVGRPRET